MKIVEVEQQYELLSLQVPVSSQKDHIWKDIYTLDEGLFQNVNKPGIRWNWIVFSAMKKNERRKPRNSSSDIWVFCHQLWRESSQWLFTFHYAAEVFGATSSSDQIASGDEILPVNYKEHESRAYPKKMERYSPRLWKWSTRFNRLYLSSEQRWYVNMTARAIWINQPNSTF